MMMLRHLLIVAVALCTVDIAVAKESIRCNGGRRLVHLRSGHIDPCSTAAARLHRRLTQVSEQASGTDSADVQQFIIAFHQRCSPASNAQFDKQVSNLGGRAISYLPDDAVLALLPVSSARAVGQLPGVAWVGEYQPEQRQSPELAALLQAVQQQGVQRVAGTLQLVQGLSDMHQQSPAVQLRHEPWHTVDTDQAADLAGSGVLLVSLDVMLVHHIIPLAAALSPESKREAQARVLQVVSHDGGTAAVGDDTAAAARTIRSIESGLAAVCGTGAHACSLRSVSEGRLVVKAALEQVAAVAALLAAQPGVHWVSLHSSPRAANYYGTAVSQCGAAESTYDVGNLYNASFPYNDEAKHPLWDAGLRGSGQILAMGDTGMDLDSCFFRDSSIPPISTGIWPNDSTGHKLYNSTVHRKVAMYRALMDTVDGDGHGTHCAGSAVGSFNNGVLSWWVGMAPLARIAFTDIGSGNSGSLAGVPYNLTTGYWPWPYVTGARVSSESWTTTASAYDINSQNTDMFAWLFQDFLPVFAAGNYGARLVDGTIASPSTAKNCMSVGATLTSLYKDSSSFPVYQPALNLNSVIYAATIVGGLKGGGADGQSYTVMQASFGPSMAALVSSTASAPLTLVRADPADGCTPFNRPTAFAGKAVIMERGNCSFQAKVVNAQAANAVAVFISNTENTGFMRMNPDDPTPGFDPPTISVPSASLPRNSARPMFAALTSGQVLKVRIASDTLPRERFESLAYFTSIGPTPDGRIKPDIVAPGTTISAHPGSSGNVGQNSCEVGLDMGTSMATPIVAGAAVLVRQYFDDGWYPNGSPVSQFGFNPSAPLVKAVMLGGAASMQGVTPSSNTLYDGVPLEPAPSVRQGFGRLLLTNALPLDSVPGGPNMQVVDQAPMLTPGETHKYCVRATGGAIAITLAWADFPCSPSATTCLVNDLDLTVQASGLAGYTLYGNGQPDRLNNVERVTIDDLDPGIVVVTVAAVTLPLGQTYSLAVQGQFDGQLATAYNPGWDHAASTLCNQPTFNVTGPSGIINDNSGSFGFVANGATPTGVQCRLATVAGATSPAPLQNWATCTSPRSYSTLPDASYVFSVRATGFALQTSQLFTVDTAVPRISITSFTASLRRAAAVFTGADASAISFRCKLDRTSSSNVTTSVPLVPTDPPTLLGQYQPCTSPVALSSLPDGGYTLSVQAQDGAGNTNGTPVTRSWTVIAPSGSYAQITGVNATAGQISFASFVTTAGAAAPALQCRVQQESDATDSNVDATSNYTSCTSPQTISGLDDGVYTFSARTAGTYAGYQSSVQFIVGAVAPRTSIVAAPVATSSAVTTLKTARFAWVSSGDVTFACSLVRSGAAGNYSTCVSPRSYPDLADGRYTFSVFGTSSAGVAGQPAAVDFTVDTTAPTTQLTFTPADSQTPAILTGPAGDQQITLLSHTFSIAFSTDDGADGSGTSMVMGRLAPLTSTSLTRSHATQQLQVTHPSASSRYTNLAARQESATDGGNSTTVDPATATVGGPAGSAPTAGAAISRLALPFAIAAAGARAQHAGNATSPGGDQSTAAAAGASTEFQVITSPLVVTLADGVYTFALYAIDEAGNAGSTSEYRVLVGSGAFAPQPPALPPPLQPPPPRNSSQDAAHRHGIHGVHAAAALMSLAAAAVAAFGL